MTLFLSDSEARSFAQGERVLWRPMRAFSNPYQPDSHVDLKETWAWFGGDYIYKADIDEHGTVFARQGTKMYFPQWRSPVTMPGAAVRWHMTVVSVDVKERDGRWGWEIKMEEQG